MGQHSALRYLEQRKPFDSEESMLRVVLTEDNQGDVLLVREALECNGLNADLTIHKDGEDMFRYIERVDAGELPCPHIILLDLNVPRKSGEMILTRLRQSDVCRDVPVVIVTSSDAPKDRETVARLGASFYFRKPSDYDEFMRLGDIVRDVVGKRGGNT